MAVASKHPLPLDVLLRLAKGYSELLRRRPLLVKSVTSGVIGALGNLAAQYLSAGLNDEIKIKLRSVYAFSVFGLIGGPLVHFFLNWLAKYGPTNIFLKVILDRFLFGPFFLMLLLYLLPRLEGRSHRDACEQLKKLYRSSLFMMWKVWIPVQFINLQFVPLQYRVLVTNLVSVGWNIYLSLQRADQKQEEEKEF